MKKFLITLLALVAMIFVGAACKTTIITQDMLKKRVVEYWYYNPAEFSQEIMLESKPLNDGDTFVEIDPPEFDGFEFEGWYASYPGPYDWIKLENGSELPEKYGLKVHASYIAKEFKVNFVVNGIYSESDQGWPAYEAYNYLETFKMENRGEILAQKLQQADSGRTYKSDFLYLDGFYMDENYTQPVATNVKFTKDTTIYVKYIYSPIYLMYSENGITVRRVDETELSNIGGILTIPSANQYGDPITTIAADVVEWNSPIKELIISNGITTIEANAFEGTGIEKIVIPESVTYIGDGAFKNCESLVYATINTNLDFDIDNVFEGCNNLLGENYKGVYYLGKRFMGVSETVTDVEIKPGCEEIPANAFKDTTLNSIIIPSSVKKIGANAFAGTNITQVTLPETIEEVGVGAFKDCVYLQDVTIDTDAIFEFNEVFENCTAIPVEEYGNAYYISNRFIRPVSMDITWAKIKPNCPYIPKNAFKDCTQLNRVYVPASVTRVGTHAFYNVNTHYFACYFENKSSSISFDAGADESILTSTNQPTNYYFHTMPSGIKLAENGIAYGYRDLLDYTGQDAYGIVIFGYFASGEDVTIEDKYTYDNKEYSVGLIFQHIFLDNDTVKKITVKSCPIIGSSAFLNAKALEEVTLPASGCTQIGTKAFSGCENLKKVSVGTGVQLIGKSAFENCNALEEVKCASPLKMWTSSGTLIATFAANENMAQTMKNNADWWCFDASFTEAQVQQLLGSLG